MLEVKMLKNRDKKEYLNQKNGFTIMETLVAIALLLLAITGPMVFSQTGLRAAFHARDQITAFYLAQDAIEFIKNSRDHNILSGNDWLSNIGNSCDAQGQRVGCTVDTTEVLGSQNPRQCLPSQAQGNDAGCLDLDEPDGSNDSRLMIDGSGYFGFDGDDESIFSRLVVVDEVVDNVEARVTVVVRWKSQESLGVREITVVEHIYNFGDAFGL